MVRLGPRVAPRIRGSKREAISRRLDLAGRPWGLTVQRYIGLKASLLVLGVGNRSREEPKDTAGYFKLDYRGARFSLGYPACPDLEDNLKVAELLEADRIGVAVSEDFQYVPEQTTSAIICHHPKAKYFVARG